MTAPGRVDGTRDAPCGLRALRPAAGALDSPHRWTAFVLDAIRRTPMPDFTLYGEPYPALNGVVLTAGQHRRLVRLTTLFAAVFEKAAAALAQDAAALERLGFPWVAVELLAHEDPATPLLLGRFDFLLDKDGRWQVLEYNADTPSGARETIRTESVIAAHLGPLCAPYARSGPHLQTTLVRAFAQALDGLPAARGARATLGIVTDAGYGEDLAQTVFLADLLRPALARRGVDVVYGDVDNLRARRGRLCLLGHRLDALYRYYPFESLLGQSAWVDLFESVTSGRLRLLNGLRGLLAQNKGLLAWIWEHRDDRATFTPAERRAIAGHLPPTRWIDDVPPDEPPGDLVLKQVFGREGEEVYFGDRLSPPDWAQCRAWGSYVVQRRVRAAPLTAVVPGHGGAPEARELWPAAGSFAARRRWAGYYTRLGGAITTGHAKFVATFWDRA
jgi:glutathionylspermidine synthase